MTVAVEALPLTVTACVPGSFGVQRKLMLVALFYRDATWHDIPHTVRLSLSEIEAEHHTGRLTPLPRPNAGPKPDPEGTEAG